MANNSKQVVVLAIVMATFSMGAGAFLFLGSAPSSSVEQAPQVAREQVAVAAPIPPIEPAPEIDPASAQPRSPATRHNRMARDVKREQIWSALDRKHDLEPAAPGSAAPTEKAAAKLPELDPEYIRTAIVEQLIPVAVECYESALADDPKLAGKLITTFTIIGEEEVGGVVEEAAIVDDESTLDSEFVRECMRESLMAVTFEPPSEGGRVEVRYPFEFAPDAPSQ